MDPSNFIREYTEADWNEVHKAEDGNFPAYCYSKTAAERAAWKFVEENKPGFDLVALNPPYVFGDNLNDVATFEELNTSSQLFVTYLSGQMVCGCVGVWVRGCLGVCWCLLFKRKNRFSHSSSPHSIAVD